MNDRHTEESTLTLSQKALLRLASIDPIELCHESKVEKCRASNDLSDCNGCVQRVLVSCGHASLCDECIHICEVCPICRVPLPNGRNELPLRLYDECDEANLIPKRCVDRLLNKVDGDHQQIADVQRLHSLFDVAFEHNLVPLIRHYLIDVCMDDRAVSTDPTFALLLDKKVVLDWCRLMFKNILAELQVIYNLTVEEMKSKLNSLLKILSKLTGLANILEVLESSFREATSSMLQDNILKTKQHLEIMEWCIRHQFLGNVRSNSKHPDIASWKHSINERKSVAATRAWPDSTNHILKSSEPCAPTLFIEDALKCLGASATQSFTGKGEVESEMLEFLSGGSHPFLEFKRHGILGCYPFENLRAAVDLLFLHGSSDVVVSKHAIFLYYIFDRHWTMHSQDWRAIIDDFAVTFSISRHSLLESLIFYLLDDHADEALKEAIRLLPEIAGSDIHPKIARVLLERESPEAALLALRLSGLDWDCVSSTSLEEAVTVIRVRVECGLLTEAFMYQRMICTKIKDKKPIDPHVEVHGQPQDWLLWLEVLVTEICCLCISRNMVDRMIELPWNSDEEKHLHKTLLDYATMDQASAAGSLLVVFYLQRYRYVEAYQVNAQLQTLEEDFLSQSQEEILAYKIKSRNYWRKKIVEQSVHLLPDVLQQELKKVKFGFESGSSPASAKTQIQKPILGSVFFKDRS